jgi:nucleoside-diphosphate-sugar epimerase
MMKQRVFITGSNGVLGKNLVKYLNTLYADSFELVLFDIHQDVAPSHSEELELVEAYTGDIRSKSDLKKAMRDIDIVVHCASASPSYTESEIYDIIINGTANLLDCSFGGGVKRFIYISSTSVYGIPQKAPIFEDDEVMPYDPYNKGKIAAEKLCGEWRGKGNCISVLRPRSFIGPGRLGTFGILYEWASEGRNFPMLGPGRNHYQLLDVEDLCQAIFLAMTGSMEQVNDLFNIGAGEFATIKEDYQAVLDAAGFGKKIISFPAKPMLAALSILEALKLSPFYKRLYRKLNLNYYVSIDKARAKLGYSPRYSNRDSLIRNYQWYLDAKQSLDRKTGAGNNVAWNPGVLSLAKLFF